MSDIRKKDIRKDISLTPIDIEMRDETPDSIREPNFNKIQQNIWSIFLIEDLELTKLWIF